MQRLFSTFPNSWPGLGLVIIRLAAGFSLIAAQHAPGKVAGSVNLLEHVLIYSIVGLLGTGLWTPIAAVAAALMQVFTVSVTQRFDASLCIAVAVDVALAMLGPGAWSLDARIFGRKRIV